MLFAPYLTSVAKQAACPGIDSDATCHTDLHVARAPGQPGSLVFYVVTLATIVSALVLPVVGALADRIYHRKAPDVRASPGPARCRPPRCSWSPATTGSSASVLTIVGNICLGSSLVVYYSILVEISTPDERDRVSSAAGRSATSAAACCWRSTWSWSRATTRSA